MKRMLLAAALAASIAFAGCATQNGATAPVLTAAQKLHNAVTTACTILMPTIEPLTPLFVTQPGLIALNTDLSLACAANAVIDLAAVNDLVNSSISAAQETIPKISSLDQTQQIVIIAALGAFKGSLQNAMNAYNAAPAQ
jgi:predicted small secreted protein